MVELTCPWSFCWGCWLSCGLFIPGLLRPGVSFFAYLPSLGLYTFLSLCLILQCPLAVWSLTLPQHVRPHDRSARSKFGINDPYKMRTFPCLTIPCLPHRCTGKYSSLAWNHLVGQLLVQKPHLFGILNLSNTFVTFQANVQRGEAWLCESHPLAIPLLSHLSYHRFWDGKWLVLFHGYLRFPELMSPQSSSLKLKY